MGIRHQPQSEKHPYESPTTPGLYVSFRDLIIELVCINVNPKIGPRFWQDKKYWAPKYSREIRGVSNLGKELDISESLTQRALIDVITKNRIKALVAKKTIYKVVRLTKSLIQKMKQDRDVLVKKPSVLPVDAIKNSTFVNTGEDSPLAKLRKVEDGKEKS